jgi:hypothetical protein
VALLFLAAVLNLVLAYRRGRDDEDDPGRDDEDAPDGSSPDRDEQVIEKPVPVRPSARHKKGQGHEIHR